MDSCPASCRLQPSLTHLWPCAPAGSVRHITMEQEAGDGNFSIQSQEMKDFRDCLRDAHKIRRDQRSGWDSNMLSTLLALPSVVIPSLRESANSGLFGGQYLDTRWMELIYSLLYNQGVNWNVYGHWIQPKPLSASPSTSGTDQNGLTRTTIQSLEMWLYPNLLLA
jgi:hypothetical protein